MKSIDQILEEPFTALKISLKSALDKKTFSAADLQAMMEKVAEISATNHTRREIHNAESAVASGTPQLPPDLDTVANQLVWAANLVYLQVNPQVMQAWEPEKRGQSVAQTPLWKDLLKSPRAVFERMQSASLLLGQVNEKTRLEWGAPGSWFYYNPEENRINIDFVNTLIGGFEHTRAAVMHEIGHSQFTTEFPPSEVALREKIEALLEEAKKRPLKKEEYESLVLTQTEHNLRHSLWNAAEDSCVNQYLTLQGTRLAQDYGDSMNHIETIVVGQGKHLLFPEAPPEKISPEMRFNSLGNAINLTFFRRNGLFADTRKDWERFIRVDDIVRYGGPSSLELPPLQDLNERTAAIGSLQPELQLKIWERAFGKEYYKNKTEALARQRNEIIEKIWDDYAAPLAKEILEKQRENVKQQLEQKQQQQQQGQGQQGQQQQSQGQSGQQPNQPGQGQSQPQSGQGEPQQGEGQSQPQPGQGESQPSPGGGVPQPGSGQPQDGQDTVDVEGVGSMPVGKLPPKTPQEEQNGRSSGEEKSEGKGQEKGEGQEGEKGSTLRELVDEGQKAQAAAEAERQRRAQAALDDQYNNSQPMTPSQGIDELPVGTWEDYAAEVERLRGPINHVARLLKQIQEKQLQSVSRPSRQLTLLPEDGDFARFSPKAQLALEVKRAAQDKMEMRDLNQFRADQDKFKPTALDVYIMIDGSGSMRSWSWGQEGKGASPQERALQTAMIFYEASKIVNRDRTLAGINTYVDIWGPPQPHHIAKPGDDPVTIGKAFAGLKEGLGSSTSLAPAIEGMTTTLSEKKGPRTAPTGFTHVQIISDGDIQDSAATQTRFEQLFASSNSVTVDLAILNRNPQTEMAKTAQSVKTAHPTQRIDIALGTDSSRVSSQMIETLLQKMRTCKSFLAIPAEAKKAQFRRAQKAMQLESGGKGR